MPETIELGPRAAHALRLIRAIEDLERSLLSYPAVDEKEREALKQAAGDLGDPRSTAIMLFISSDADERAAGRQENR